MLSAMKAWLQLIRPSNVLTAISDVWAGMALSCMFLAAALPEWAELGYIGLASMLLYMGGIVLNDVFDAKLDAVERPERPIPSGRVSLWQAIALGSIANIAGCYLASMVNTTALYIAVAIVAMCILYNAAAKKHFIAGPIVMGMCRGLNLLLGMSLLPEALSYWWIVLVPIVYIAAITNISRGEVYGNNRKAMLVSAALYALVIITLLFFTLASQNYIALAFIALFIYMIGSPLRRALRTVEAMDIRGAVKSGVLALFLLNASWIAISGFWWLAIGICLLLPLSIVLAKKYSVT